MAKNWPRSRPNHQSGKKSPSRHHTRQGHQGPCVVTSMLIIDLPIGFILALMAMAKPTDADELAMVDDVANITDKDRITAFIAGNFADIFGLFAIFGLLYHIILMFYVSSITTRYEVNF